MSEELMPFTLRGRKVLVTGATGFIGGRLVEKLVLEHGAHVRVLVRSYSRAARIARFEVEMVPGTIEDAVAVEEAVRGTDVVFSLAYVGSNGVPENVAAVDSLIAACLAHDVHRLVHLSTFAVHEPFRDGFIDEETPCNQTVHAYAESKIAVERRLRAAVEASSLPAVILRPSIVYGPYGGYWTDRPAQNLMAEGITLPNLGIGLCNPVYVDDLVDAMVLAAERPNVVGETFLISGPDSVTWAEFYAGLQAGLGPTVLRTAERTDPLRSDPGAQRRRRPSPREIARGTLRWARPIVRKLPGPARAGLRRLRRALARDEQGLPPVARDFDYQSRARCCIDKAQRMLGYAPRFNFTVGMAMTQEYLRWAYPPAKPLAAEKRSNVSRVDYLGFLFATAFAHAEDSGILAML